MRTKTAIRCVVVWSFLGLNASADEIAIPLPRDGAWARYHVTTTNEPGTLDEISTRIETIRIVGTEESEGSRYRWVEQTFAGFPDRKTNVLKTLVAEADLKSPWPLAAERSWWHKMGDAPAGEGDSFGPEYAIFSLVFPGPYGAATPLKEVRTVEYQRGRLEIREGLTGGQRLAFKGIDHDIEFAMEYAAWRHPEVPLGLAAAKVTLRTVEANRLHTYTAEFVLEDFGTDAVTALPENN